MILIYSTNPFPITGLDVTGYTIGDRYTNINLNLHLINFNLNKI